jgi:hypothetical protein
MICAIGEQLASLNGRLAVLELARRRRIAREIAALGSREVIGEA